MSGSPYDEPASPISEDSDTAYNEEPYSLPQHQEPPAHFTSSFNPFKDAPSGSSSKRRLPLSGWFGGSNARDSKSRRREDRDLPPSKRGAASSNAWSTSSELAGATRVQRGDELLDHAQVERLRTGECALDCIALRRSLLMTSLGRPFRRYRFEGS